MREHLDIGSTPPEEDCAQVGSNDYYPRARRECRAYINLLRRALGPEPPGAELRINSNPHDLGIYLSVACYYDPTDSVSADYAFRCEVEGPSAWDEDAIRELSSRSTSTSPEKGETYQRDQ